MIKKVLKWFGFAKTREEKTILIRPRRKRGMLSLGVQRDPDETPCPWEERIPGIARTDSCDYSGVVNLGREIENRSRTEGEDERIEELRKVFGETDEDEGEVEELKIRDWR
jgi:hypothetical protein